MNHLRSAAFAVVSASLLVVAAGCNADASDPTDDAVPQTEIQSKGVETKAWADGVTEAFCPKEDKTEAKLFYQVQASRVSKYLFGGNDPWDLSTDPATGNPVGASKEYGDAGSAKPDLSNPQCVAAMKCFHNIHDTLYPPCASRMTKAELDKLRAEDPVKYRALTSKDAQCPAATSTLGSGALSKRCDLPSDLFKIKLDPNITDKDFELCVEGVDACWGVGVSGFIYPATPPADPDKPRQQVVMATDPQPADLWTPLAATVGATASAYWTGTPFPTQAILWPLTWTAGAAYPGQPCSPFGLPPGARTSRQIVADGSLRKCL